MHGSLSSRSGASYGDAGGAAVKLRVLTRLIQIQRVLLKHGLDDFVRATHLYRPLRFLFFLSPGVWFERRRRANHMLGESRVA